MDNNSIGGKWNILGEKYDGELIYNPSNGLILISIYYNNEGGPTWYGKPLKFNEITGTLNQKISCILSDCEVVKRHSRNFTRHHVVIRAKTIIFGTNIRKQQNLKFNRIDFRLTNIFPWTNMNGFEESFDNPEYNFMITHKLNDTIVINVDDNTKIEFVHYSGPIDGNMNVEEIQLSQYVIIRIYKKNKCYYDEFFKELDKIRNLIMVATEQNVFIKEISCYNEEKYYIINGKKEYVKFQMIDYRMKNESEEISIMDMHYYLFRLSDLLDNDRLKLWANKYNKNEKIYELYLLSIKNDVPMEIKFCNYMQAIELFHRQTYKSYNRTFKNHISEKFIDNQELKNEIVENHDQKGSPFITLRSRLIDIFTEDKELLKSENVKENVVKFSDIMCNTRNYYTHYDENKKDKCLVKENLICGINILNYLLCYIILDQLDFDVAYIDNKLKERMEYILRDKKIEKLLKNER